LSEPTTFKLMCEALSLSVKQVAQYIIRVPVPTARNYTYNVHSVPLEVMEKMTDAIGMVDELANKQVDSTKGIDWQPLINPILHRAVTRRILEIHSVRAYKSRQADK